MELLQNFVKSKIDEIFYKEIMYEYRGKKQRSNTFTLKKEEIKIIVYRKNYKIKNKQKISVYI